MLSLAFPPVIALPGAYLYFAFAFQSRFGHGDADTADLFTEVSRELDKHLWFLESHLQG